MNYLISSDSENFQRMLAGTKIYFSFMFQKKYLNMILLILMFLSIISIFFSMLFIINQDKFPITSFLIPIAFYIILLFGIILFSIWKEHHFSLNKGMKIFFKNSIVIFGSIASFIIGIWRASMDPLPNLADNIIGFTAVYIFTLLLLFRMLLSQFKPLSMIKYAKEQLIEIGTLEKENKKEKLKLSRYQLYYLAIYQYYKMELKELKDIYNDDVQILLKLDKVPILASQIIYNDIKHRKELINILSELEKTVSIKDAKKFIKIMKEIDKKFSGYLVDKESENKLKEVFQKKKYVDKLKTILLAIIPVITVILSYFLQKI